MHISERIIAYLSRFANLSWRYKEHDGKGCERWVESLSPYIIAPKIGKRSQRSIPKQGEAINSNLQRGGTLRIEQQTRGYFRENISPIVPEPHHWGYDLSELR